MDFFHYEGFYLFLFVFYVDIVEIAICSILSPLVGVACIVGSDDKVSL